MTKREIILEHIRVAAYDGDTARALRLYVENRVSFTAYQAAVERGRAARLAADAGKRGDGRFS